MKVKKAMAAAAIILLTAAQTMTAQATTQDTSWTFVIDKYTDTTVRSKDNTTPTYICVDRLSVKAKVQVWGSIPVGSNLVWQNKTQFVSSVVASPGGQSLIHTLVYESGGRYAKLRGFSLDAKSSSKGVWSPDSTRNYTFLN